MNKESLSKTIVVGVVVVGLVAAAFIFKQNESTDTAPNPMPTANNATSGDEASSSTEIEETNMVTYRDFEVEPSLIRVKKGTTVTWTNADNAMHDVTPTTETDDFKASKLFGVNETYSVTFNTVGTYTYICSPHPYMKGTVEVIES